MRRHDRWHRTWMQTAHVIAAENSPDVNLRVAAIIVSEDNAAMLALGYNGNARGLPDERESQEPGKSEFVHAEQNALVKCVFHYPVAKVMYVTHSPCKMCAKLIVNAGIKRVIYDEEYRDTTGIDLLRGCGIRVDRYRDLLDDGGAP